MQCRIFLDLMASDKPLIIMTYFSHLLKYTSDAYHGNVLTVETFVVFQVVI